MARLIGVEHAKHLNCAAYDRLAGDNCGAELTTEGIIEGFDAIVSEMEADPEKPLDAIEESAFFIRG